MACHVPRELTTIIMIDIQGYVFRSPYYHVLMRTVNVHTICTTPCFLVMSRSLHDYDIHQGYMHFLS